MSPSVDAIVHGMEKQQKPTSPSSLIAKDIAKNISGVTPSPDIEEEESKITPFVKKSAVGMALTPSPTDASDLLSPSKKAKGIVDVVTSTETSSGTVTTSPFFAPPTVWNNVMVDPQTVTPPFKGWLYDQFESERIEEERQFRDPYMLELEGAEISAQTDFSSQMNIEEAKARLSFMAQLELYAPSEMSDVFPSQARDISGGMLMEMTPEERTQWFVNRNKGREESLNEKSYTDLQKSMFGEEIKTFEENVTTWKADQTQKFEEQVSSWRVSEESRLEEHVLDWRSSWRPKGLAERIFESPLKDKVPGITKYFNQLSGIVASGESFAYGVGNLLGTWTPRTPGTVFGGLISSITGSIKSEKVTVPGTEDRDPLTGEVVKGSGTQAMIRHPTTGMMVPQTDVTIDPKWSSEMENVYSKGTEYMMGSVVGDIALSFGLTHVGGKVLSKTVSPFKGTRVEKYLLQHSDWYFKRYGKELAPQQVFHGLPTGKDIPISMKTLQAEDFMWDQLLAGKEFGRKWGRASAMGVPGGVDTSIKWLPVTSYSTSQLARSPMSPMVSSREDFSRALKNIMSSKRGGAPLVNVFQAPQRVSQLVTPPISAVSRTVTRDPGKHMWIGLIALRGAGMTEPPIYSPKTFTPTTPGAPTYPKLGLDVFTGTKEESDQDALPMTGFMTEQESDVIQDSPLDVKLDTLVKPYITPKIDPIFDTRIDVDVDTLVTPIIVQALDDPQELKLGTPQFQTTGLQTPKLEWVFPRYSPTALRPPRIRRQGQTKRRKRRVTKVRDPLAWDKQLLDYPIAGEGAMLSFIMGGTKIKKRRKKRR